MPFSTRVIIPQELLEATKVASICVMEYPPVRERRPGDHMLVAQMTWRKEPEAREMGASGKTQSRLVNMTRERARKTKTGAPMPSKMVLMSKVVRVRWTTRGMKSTRKSGVI